MAYTKNQIRIQKLVAESWNKKNPFYFVDHKNSLVRLFFTVFFHFGFSFFHVRLHLMNTWPTENWTHHKIHANDSLFFLLCPSQRYSIDLSHSEWKFASLAVLFGLEIFEIIVIERKSVKEDHKVKWILVCIRKINDTIGATMFY